VTRDEIRTAILAQLAEIAPDADAEGLDGSADLRDELDLDSMDFLNVIRGVHTALGVEIPESDYRRLATLDGFVAYLDEKLGPR
jgi:acyl carrier protein